jgi:hypothetical protein
VVLTGQLADPRPAYAAADVMLGMGGSALRALAFAKPLVVQGECGFWSLLTAQTQPVFLRQGWYGVGSDVDGRVAGAARLAEILRPLLLDVDRRSELGQLGRDLVVGRFSLQAAAALLEQVYTAAVADAARSRRSTVDTLGTIGGVARHKLSRKWQRWRGTVATDDFNAVASPNSRGGRT